MGEYLKTCPKCNTEKPATLEFFHKNSANKTGLSGWCKDCNNARQKAYQNTPAFKLIQPGIARKWRLKFEYGMTCEEWDGLFKEQNNACAACDATEPRGGRWHVDHNHITGEVCGIICHKCNIGIGHFDDDLDLILKNAAYLQRTREKENPEPTSPSVNKELYVS